MEDTPQITALLTACKQNDPKAQLEIYNRYYKAMFNTALRIVGDFDDAEDVMQEAFIKAFGKLDTYQAKATFGAWLKRIVINESITWLRKGKKIQCEDVEHLPETIEETEWNFDPENIKIKSLIEALRLLKSKYRTALSLYYIEGYDYEEITGILNVSYANARALVSRGKQQLKKILVTEFAATFKE